MSQIDLIHCIHDTGRFKVVIPDKAGPGVIMLQNCEWAGLHIAIKSHRVQTVSSYRDREYIYYNSY